MLYKLPVGSFEIIPVEVKTKILVAWIRREGKCGYIPKENMPKRAQGEFGYYIECSWNYPEKGTYWNSITKTWVFCEDLHKRNNDYPLGPETMIQKEYSTFSAKYYEGEVPSQKLIARLGQHEHDVRHYIELQEILKQGAVLTEIHKITRFKQEAFARDYVTLNNNLRKEATANNDEFGKEFFKLMNNSCYGQLMMNELKFKRGKFVRGYKTIYMGQKFKEENLSCRSLNVLIGMT